MTFVSVIGEVCSCKKNGADARGLPMSAALRQSTFNIQNIGNLVVTPTSIPQLADPGEAGLFDGIGHEMPIDGIPAKGRVVPRSALAAKFGKCLFRADTVLPSLLRAAKSA